MVNEIAEISISSGRKEDGVSLKIRTIEIAKEAER